jgi:hypothetical protein
MISNLSTYVFLAVAAIPVHLLLAGSVQFLAILSTNINS